MKFVYLHGFASSPASKKAQYFRRRFLERGIELEIPDLAAGDFENLTVSGQLAVVERVAQGEPVSLLGSSMGGYLAALYASLHPETASCVLMAPAFHFAKLWGPELAAWKRDGYLEVHHYAEGRPARVSYGLIEDALRYPGEPSFAQPALIFHGTNDTVVPYRASVEFAARHPNARLELFDSGHELTDVVDRIWAICARHHPQLSA
jgi:hypothetical protein